jgi:hypothetical protein
MVCEHWSFETYDRPLFSRFQEQEEGMSKELVMMSLRPVRRVGSISFQMPSSDVLELSDILFVHVLKKNLLLVSFC